MDGTVKLIAAVHCCSQKRPGSRSRHCQFSFGKLSPRPSALHQGSDDEFYADGMDSFLKKPVVQDVMNTTLMNPTF